MNQRPDDPSDPERDSQPGEYRPEYRVVGGESAGQDEAFAYDPDDLRYVEPGWRDALDDVEDAEPRYRRGEPVPPDRWDMDRAEGDDYGARWLGGAGRLLAILALLGLLVPLLAAIFGTRGTSLVTIREQPARERARVLDVINGNTIQVDVDGRNSLVYLIGVDAPGPAHEFYDVTSSVLRRWVDGKFVELESDQQDSDPEGRLLRYVWVDNVMINAALIVNGLAGTSTRLPNDRYSPAFISAEEDAQSNGRGIWENGGRGA